MFNSSPFNSTTYNDSINQNTILTSQVIIPRLLNRPLNSAIVTYSNIQLPLYSDSQCTIQDATLGQLNIEQINIIDRYIKNNTTNPISVQLYDTSETLSKVTYSWDGITYADPTTYHTINPGEIQNFKVKIDLTATSTPQSFLIGKRVRSVV